MTKDIQQRGHCQYCGREQAIVSGHMAHHGYEVARWGFFNGACSGHDYAPIEQSRERLDRRGFELRASAASLNEGADDLEAGKVDPQVFYVQRRELVGNRWRDVDYAVPYCYGDEYEQRQARTNLIYSFRSEARQKIEFCDMMDRLADEVHGKPLRVVEKKAAPSSPVRKGHVARRQEGADLAVRQRRSRVLEG